MIPRLIEIWNSFVRALSDLGRAAWGGLEWWFGGVAELPRQVGSLLVAFGRGLWFLLLIPLRLLAGLWNGLLRARGAGAAIERSAVDVGKSVRAAAVDLREAVETQPQTLQDRWRARKRSFRSWFRDRGRWQRVLIFGLMGAILLVAGGAYPGWVWFRGWRATQLLNEAESLFTEGRRAEAFFKGQAAYFTDPENADILSRLIDFSREVRSPNTLRFGEALMRQGQFSAGSLATLVEEAQDRRRPQLARAYLSELERLDPSHPAIPRLRLKAALARGQREEAFAIAQIAFREQPFEREVCLLYAALGLEASDTARRSEVSADFRQLVNDPGEPGRLAAMVLLQYESGLTFEEGRTLIDRVLSDEEATGEERLFAWGRALALELSEFADLRTGIRAEFDLERVEGRVNYATWLLRLGRFAEAVSEFTVEEVSEDRVLFSIYLVGLMESDQADRGLELVRSPAGLLLPDYERLILEARMLKGLGREEAFVSTLERAIARCTEEQFQAAERLLQQFGEQRFLTQFYEKFSNSPGRATWSNANLLINAYARIDDNAVVALMARSQIDLLSEIPIAQGLLAYLRGLKDEQVPANIRTTERLVAQFPTVIDFRVALAVNYFRAGYLSDAAEVMEGTSGAELEKLPGMDAVSRAILRFIEEQSLEPSELMADERMLELERSFLRGLGNSKAPPDASVGE